MSLSAALIVLLLAQSGVAPATTASTAEELARHVQVSLSLPNGKAVFRSGEPIRLIASFTADRPGYQVDTTIDKHAQLEDQILITPEKGVFRWRELLSTPDGYGRDYGTRTALSAQRVDMTFPLNYWLRFDQPGDYTVRLRTRRIRTSVENLPVSAAWLTTNEVTFTIVMMSEQEEAVEARRLSARLDMLPQTDLKVQTERCEDLAFLAGDAGTREKVRRYLQPQGDYAGNWLGDLGMGLYIARSTSLVVALLEADMRDLTKPVEHITTLAGLRLWMEMPSLVAEANGDMDVLRARKRSRLEAFRTEYLNEAIASLSQRTGYARRETAASLVSILRHHDGTPLTVPQTPLPSVVRSIIVDEFAELEPMTQGFLVQVYWKEIRDLKLLPALEKMLTSPDDWVRGQPMAAILDIAPERAKPIFIAQMLGPRPINDKAFLQLRDKTLPEMDLPLLEQIARVAASSNPQNRYVLKTKTEFLARYASAAILSDVQQLYAARGSTMEVDTRVHLISYLDRWDVAGTAERLDRALAAESDAGMLLYGLANARYSGAIDAVLRTRLDSADSRIVEGAASLLSVHGAPDVRAVLESRLNRWMSEWRERAAELQPAPAATWPQARLQISLIRAILNGKAWKISEAEAVRLTQNCLTAMCRTAFGIR